MDLFDLELEASLHNLIKLVIALVLAIPIGWERGVGSKSIGFRTFPIVAISSCGFVLISRIISDDAAVLGSTIQGMLSGIGFIGGGAILKVKTNVQGIVTAASIWNTGAIGISVALGELEVALFLSLINFLALYFLTPVADIGYLDPQDGLFRPNKEKKGLYDSGGNEVEMKKKYRSDQGTHK